MKETPIRDAILLDAPRCGVLLFRNNCGVAIDPDAHCKRCGMSVRESGRWIRYGIGNPGGSDLIGFTEVVVTPAMVGKRFAIFTAVEVKRPGQKATDKQENFLKVIETAGGVAGTCVSVEAFRKLVRR